MDINDDCAYGPKSGLLAETGKEDRPVSRVASGGRCVQLQVPVPPNFALPTRSRPLPIMAVLRYVAACMPAELVGEGLDGVDET